MHRLSLDVIEDLKRYLREDIRSGDITTAVMGPLDTEGIATVFAKSKAILAGTEEIVAIAELSGLTYERLMFEGNWVSPGDPVIRLRGPTRVLLGVERVCLNIIMRMSGIATKVYKMVKEARAVNKTVRVAATRKTTPGFRFFEKRAVQVGGGDSHRYALDDMVLIKNNHISVVGGVAQAVRAAKETVSFSKKVSCEVRSLSEAIAAITSGADIVLLDNFSPEEAAKVRQALVERDLRNRVILEISGGVDEDNVRAYAECGVDVLSSGALTHSYTSADFNMSIALK